VSKKNALGKEMNEWRGLGKGNRIKTPTKVTGEDRRSLFNPELERPLVLVVSHGTEWRNELDDGIVVRSLDVSARLEEPRLRRLVAFTFAKRISTLPTGGFGFIAFNSPLPVVKLNCERRTGEGVLFWGGEGGLVITCRSYTRF